MSALLTVSAVLLFYGLFYRRVVKRLGGIAQRVLGRSSAISRHGLRDVNDIAKLLVAGASQLTFAVSLWMLLGVPGARMVSTMARPDLLVLGLTLGFAELGLATMICRTVVQLPTLLSGNPSPIMDRWLAEGRGGWMRQFGAASRVAPRYAALAIMMVYVTGEEMVFRAALVHVLGTAGPVAAVVGSTILFVAVQAFGMPSLRATTFPIIGSLVIGAVHSWLYIQVPTLVPLVLAHLVFLVGAVNWLGPRRIERTK